MGTSMGLYEVDNQLLGDLQKMGLLPTLVNVLIGDEPPAAVGLSEPLSFRQVDMEQAWDDIYYLFRGLPPVNGTAYDYFYRQRAVPARHPTLNAVYYMAEHVLFVLTRHRQFATDVARLSDPGREFPTRHVSFPYVWKEHHEMLEDAILTHQSIDESVEVIHAYAQTGVQERENSGIPMLTHDRQPFDAETVDTVMDAYRRLIHFMTETVYREENDADIPVHAGIVGVQS